MGLILLLIVLLIGLGGFALWQFGPSIGIDIAKMFSGTSSSSGSVVKPVITDLSIKAVADHKSALITWTTGQLTSSQVEYGTTTSYGLLVPAVPATDPTTGQSLGVTAHEVELTGLSASTPYHYRVKSRNKAGETVSSDKTFQTTSAELP